MAEKYVISITMVAAFFKENMKQLHRGENSYKSCNVLTMNFDATVDPAVLKGKVKASMKGLTYSVEVSINLQDNYIENATCSCPRGQAVCHHMAALCIHAHNNVSITDKECAWNKKKGGGEENVKTLKELYPSKHGVYEPINGEVSDDVVQMFHRSLGHGNAVGFSWLLQPHVCHSAMEFLPIIDELVFNKEYLETSNKRYYIEERCQLTPEQITCVVKNTVGQANNANWLMARKNRITASNFGVILAAIHRNRFPPSLFKRLMDGYDLTSVRAVQWGKENEKSAIDTFTSAFTEMNVTPTGLWLDKCGFLGASPDGLVGDNSILEVKCPYKYRNTSLQQALRNDKTYIIFKEGEESMINVEHEYYHQVQGQLHLSNRDACYLIIWTPNECEVAYIEKDPNWGDNLILLKSFYLEKFIPYLSGMER